MGDCCGKIGWSYPRFWATSLPEIFIALEAFAEFHGAKKDDDDPISEKELAELARKYPDKPRH